MLMCNLAITGTDRASLITKTTQTGYRGMRMQLNDKVIIITGGCQGLGRSMAEYFAGKGAKLALVDLNQEKLDDAGGSLQVQGRRGAQLSVQRGQ